jgi:hypothetical protein
MDLQSKTYTNEKLARLGITNNEMCGICENTIETRDHLFIECPRAETAWKVYEELVQEPVSTELIKHGPTCKYDLNLFSLIKATIVRARNKPINPINLKIKCETRSNDMRSVGHNKKLIYERKEETKIIMNTFQTEKLYNV